MALQIKQKAKFLIALSIIIPTLSAGALYLAKPVQGATCSWSGGSGDWESAGNWTNCSGGVPGSLDDVVIDADVTVDLNGTTTINSLTLGDASGTYSPTLNFDYDAIADGALIVTGGNLIVYTEATISHTVANENTVIGTINIDIQDGSATIDGEINTQGKGYPGKQGDTGYGPGGGEGSCASNFEAAGGGYGGLGGENIIYAPGGGGEPYGSSTMPSSLGSAGGGGQSGDCRTGGYGGGAAKLNVNTTLTIDGTITSSGSSAWMQRSGGGAGGSIYVITNTLAGSGSLSADGGNGNSDGGGGSGGRIAIYFNSSSFSGTVTANAGLKGGTDGRDGENGTVLWINDSTNDLYIRNTQIWRADPSLEGTSHSYNHVTVTDNATWYLQGYYTTNTNGVGFNFNINDFTIETGSSVSMNGRGYRGNEGADGDGPEGGTGSCSSGYEGGGAGHGGLGGDNIYYGQGGATYGAVVTPSDLGSAGGGGQHGDCRSGGNGGGALYLNTAGTLSIDGTLSANGNQGIGERTGGGAGGSIYLKTNTLTGSGDITSDGADGKGNGGGGGGGRLAIHYNSSTFSGTTSADGGLKGGSSGIDGENGTIVWVNQLSNSLYIKNSQTWRAAPSLEGTIPSYTNISVTDNSTWYLDGYYTTNNNGIGFSFSVTNFTVDSGSTINLDGRGYLGNAGEDGDGPEGGEGACTTSYRGGGGGHGGSGGDTIYGQGGETYGSSTSPYELGSAGGGGQSGDCRTGGNGGGALMVDASDTITINGEISADGTTNWAQRTGGGAGGSIFIIADTFTGSGNITAHGGDGNDGGGGGGGGRISIEYISTNSWSGNTLNPANAATAGSGGSGAENGTVEINQLSTGYVTNLSAGLNSFLSNDWSTDMEQSGNAAAGYKDIGIANTSGHRVAEFTIKLDGDVDWTDVSGGTSTTDLKSFFHVSGGFSNIDGYNSSYDSYTLYVPKGTGSRVGICPGATNLNDVHSGCSGLVYYDSNDSNVEVVSIGSITYWKVSGLTSTGGFSSVENMTDIMDRLQVSTASNHEIVFPTAGGIDANTDTITVEFDPSAQSWDLGSIALGDIDLEDDGADKTLAGSAGAGTWGVSINTSTDIITFTAPTDTAADEIADDSVITIKIGTNADGGSNQIVNPSSAGQYEIEMRMNTADSEYGIVEVAIVDDDTVNITSYIDSFILFDIDTSDTDEDCDASGGASPCDSHSGSTDDSGYTVDLGEMSYLSVNESGDSVTHADSLTGSINYIFFDLSTNAAGGATVTLISANGSLDASGSNTIPSVTNDGDGVTISAGDGAYGIREVSNATTSGTFTIAGDYDGGASIFGECTTTATQIFSTTSAPMDTGRLQMAVGASPDSSDGTGTYTDTLTFIVTSTF